MNFSRLIRERVNRPLLGRGRFSLTFDEGQGVRRLTQTTEPLHYSDAGEMRDIDTSWVQDGSLLRIADAGFDARADLNLQAAEVMRITAAGLPLSYKPLPLYYANAASDLLAPATMQRLVAPRAVTATVDDDVLRWAEAYGPGMVLEWQATPTGVQKWLTIDSAARFPQALIPGPRALVFGFAVTMPGLRAALAGGLLDLTNVEVDERFVTLEADDGQPIFALQRPFAIDAAGATLEGKLRFRRLGGSLVIAASFPLAWFASPERQYPVRIDPTVTHEHTDSANHISAKESVASTSAGLLVGTSSSSNVDWQMFIRWPGVAIPQGAGMQSAALDLSITAFAGTPGATAETQCEDVNSSTTPTSASDFFARARTAAGSPYAPGSATGRHTFGDFKAAVQTVVNRPGWVSGAALGTFTRDVVRANAAINRLAIARETASAGSRPVLNATYTEPSSGGGSGGAVDEITVTLRPRASGDDGYTYTDTSGATPFNTTTVSTFVNDIEVTRYDYRAFTLLTLDAGQVLPNAAQLKSAVLHLPKSGGASGPTAFRITLAGADNPTAPGSQSDFDGRAKLTPISYTPDSSWAAGETRTVDVTALAQSIVNRAGYSSGRMLLFLLHAVTGWGGSNNNYSFRSYDGDPAGAIKLVVTFYDPNPPVVGGTVALI